MKLNNIYMVHHHVCYEEIHGYELVILMPIGKHRKLHNRLRKQGKCNISVNKLNKITNKSNYHKKYNQYLYHKTFRLSQAKNISLRIRVHYNLKTDNIFISSGFEGINKHKLLKINIEE